MSTYKHLKRAVQILRDAFENDIVDTLETEGQWTWNLKNWTIQVYESTDYKSVVAYKAHDGLTDWSDYTILEAQQAKWEVLV